MYNISCLLPSDSILFLNVYNNNLVNLVYEFEGIHAGGGIRMLDSNPLILEFMKQ